MTAYFAENWLKARRQETDERLLVEAAQRDPRRFAELYELHFHRVYAYVVGRVGRREEAEDVTSDVFHQALARLQNYEWRGVPFSAWLIRIAANATLIAGGGLRTRVMIRFRRMLKTLTQKTLNNVQHFHNLCTSFRRTSGGS
jgi:hypothetical protein